MAKIGINMSMGAIQEEELVVGIDLGTTQTCITPVFLKGEANGNEMLSYALELALPLLDGLPEKERLKVETVASKTHKRMAKLRNGLAECLPLRP